MSDWESDDETDLLWDQYGTALERTTPRKWNLYPWEKNLKIMNRENQLKKFDEQYNLPEQKSIYNDSKHLVEKLKISDDAKKSAISTLELIVTFYTKKTKQRYKSNNGWLELIIPFIVMKQAPAVIYNLFEAIQNHYILRNDAYINKILYLILFYHDPQLALFLQEKQVSFDNFCKKWIKTLLAGACTFQTISAIWKYYFNPEGRERDPLFILFLIIVIITRSREKILARQNDDDEVVVTPFLSSLPSHIKPEDVDLICSLAEKYKSNTPSSAREEFHQIFFNDTDIVQEVPDFPCLYVLPSEVIVEIDAVYANQPLQPIKYLVVDCRPVDQFAAGHLPTAFNLDYTLHYQNPSLFANQVDKLLSVKPEMDSTDSYAPKVHLCFMGSGHDEEDHYLVMIVASIMEAYIEHISILKNGYAGIHDCYEDQISCRLEDHDPKRCLICNPSMVKRDRETVGRKNKILTRIGSILRCVNVGPDDEDDEDGYSLGVIECPRDKVNFEIVSIEAYKRKLKVLQVYECQQINILNKEEYESLLIITDYNIVLLRIVKYHPHAAYIMAIHRFSSVIKIKAPKDDLNLITLQYGEIVGDQAIVKEKYRVRVANGVEVAEFIKNQVFIDARRLSPVSTVHI